MAATISFKLFSNYSLLKSTLKILVIIAFLAFYDFMHKNSLLGTLCTGMSSLDDIVREIEGDANASDDGRDEEADQDPPVAPPHCKFLKCLEVVERYMCFQHGSDEENHHMHLLQLQAWAIRKQPSSTQTTLDK